MASAQTVLGATRPLPAAMCRRCRETISALIGSSDVQTVGSIDSLIEGSKARCQICSIILAEIQEAKAVVEEDLRGDGDVTVELRVMNRETPMKISIDTVESRQNLGQLIIALRDPGLPLSPIPVPHVVTKESLFNRPHCCPENASHTPTQTAMWFSSYITSWVEKCDAEHGEACNRGNDVELPTRLIRITGKTEVKLLLTSELETNEMSSVSYASVSHVWGDSQLFKLTTENIDDLKQCIPYESLARKFQEAIAIAFTAGIRYLWIDTLCIIQNSTEDWRREAKRMKNVYQNAILNFGLVGSSASDVCLTDRNVLGLCRAGWTTQHPTAGPINLYLSRSSLFISRIFNLVKERPPMFTRGWIWQERFLARRTVYLGESQLVWECGRCLWLESTGFTDRYDQLAIWTFCKRTLTGAVPRNWDFLPDPDGVGKWKSHWENFTAGYTAAKLTYQSDKLIAVAGIARLFADLSGATYVGGMWQEHIRRGSLLWKTNSRLPRPQTFRGAPSWSWASVDGELSFGARFVRPSEEERQNSGMQLKLHEPCIDLVALDVTYPEAADTIFGEVKLAVIRVKGRLFRPEYLLCDQGKKLQVTKLVVMEPAACQGQVFRDFGEGNNRFEAILDAPINTQDSDIQTPVVDFCALSTADSYFEGLILSTSGGDGLRQRLGTFTLPLERYADAQRLLAIGEVVVAIK